MSQTATPEEARAHARAQAGRLDLGPGDDPCRPRPSTCPPASMPPTVVWDETIAAGGYAARMVERGTRVRLTDLAATPAPTCSCYNAGPPDRAPQRRRHRQGAVAGVPRRGDTAAVRHGPGAACRSAPTLVVATTRCAVPRTRRATRRSTGTRRARAHAPMPATASRWRWRSSGSDAPTSCPTSTSSSTCGSRADGALRLRRHAVGRRCVRGAARRAAGDRGRREHAARARSAARVHGNALRITAWADAPTTRDDARSVVEPREPSARTSNTEDLLRAMTDGAC